MPWRVKKGARSTAMSRREAVQVKSSIQCTRAIADTIITHRHGKDTAAHTDSCGMYIVSHWAVTFAKSLQNRTKKYGTRPRHFSHASHVVVLIVGASLASLSAPSHHWTRPWTHSGVHRATSRTASTSTRSLP
eukprot:5445246-Prymnesium_polylepis.1